MATLGYPDCSLNSQVNIPPLPPADEACSHGDTTMVMDSHKRNSPKCLASKLSAPKLADKLKLRCGHS